MKMRNYLKVILTKHDGGPLSQYLAVVSVNILMFLTGIHAGWASPSLKKLMSDEYPFVISEEEGSNIAIVSFVGDIVGGISGSILIDKLGRRNTLLCLAVPYSISFLLISLSMFGPLLLYCARILGGISEGAAIAIVPIYVAEVADPQIRGKLGTIQLLIMPLGQLFINIISEYMTIQNVANICLVFPLIYAIFFLHMPESPYYLLSKNKKTAAMESLSILRRTSKVEKELDLLENDVKRQMSERGGFKELFGIRTNRKAFVLANSSRFFQQMTGCTAFGTYYQIMIGKASDVPPMLATSILLIAQISLTFVSYNFIDFYGRKTLLIISSSLTSSVLFLLGGFIFLKDFTTIETSNWDIFPVIMICLFILTYIIGFGAVTNIFIAELYSSSIKSKATALGSVNMSLMMIVTVKYYQFTADNFSLAVPFLTFATFTLVSIFFFHTFIFETKGKSLEMIQMELINK